MMFLQNKPHCQSIRRKETFSLLLFPSILFSISQACLDDDCVVSKVEHCAPGTNISVSVSGNTEYGCRFIYQDERKTFSCCYSALARGEDLCDPDRQDDRCRKKDTYRVEEREGTCVIFLNIFQQQDVGDHHVVFPGKLADNKWVKMETDEKDTENDISTEPKLEEENNSLSDQNDEDKSNTVTVLGVMMTVLIVALIVLVVYSIKQNRKMKMYKNILTDRMTDEGIRMHAV